MNPHHYLYYIFLQDQKTPLPDKQDAAFAALQAEWNRLHPQKT